MSHRLFYFFYRILVYPFLLFVFRLLARRNPKIREGLKLREPDENGILPWLRLKKSIQPIWIHCASGEFEYAKPVIRELKARQPQKAILVTYFSPSYVRAIESFDGVDYFCPIPWDQPKALQDFIAYHQPSALLIARTDTWPEMLRQAYEANCPILLFAATLTARSGRMRGLGRWVTRSTYRYLTQVHCVSAEDKELFTRLGLGDRTEVAGDTRYDQVVARLAHPKPLPVEIFSDHKISTLVAGSTWPADEEVLCIAAARLKERVRFVFVPHEPTPEHIEKLEAKLHDMGLKTILYSRLLLNPKSDWAGILLVDQVGILAELYAQADFAFVGGSFRKTVHSVMEPLAAGCITWVGPLHSNNREALEFKQIGLSKEIRCVQVAHDADEMIRQIESILTLSQTLSLSTLRTELKAEISKRTGAAARVVQWFHNHSNALRGNHRSHHVDSRT
jgi:3-deoxy-D-manno-octulosonic-acid transferase